MLGVLVVAAVFLVALVFGSVRIAQEYQRAVIFRFGRMVGMRGPGLFFKLPWVERAVIVDTRIITRQLETQETVTRDGVAVRVNAVLWFRAADPVRTIVASQTGARRCSRPPRPAMRDTDRPERARPAAEGPR